MNKLINDKRVDKPFAVVLRCTQNRLMIQFFWPVDTLYRTWNRNDHWQVRGWGNNWDGEFRWATVYRCWHNNRELKNET